MKFMETAHLFPYPFSTLTTANYRKYPNTHSPHVRSVDILSRTVLPNGILRTERLLGVTQSVPALLRRVLPIPDVMYFREVSFLDRGEKSFVAVSRNLSLSEVVTVEERCEFADYNPNASETSSDSQASSSAQSVMPIPTTIQPDDAKTVFKQRASISALGALSYVARLVEESAVAAYERNAVKGRQGLESVIEMVKREAEDIERNVSEGFREVERSVEEGLRGVEKGLREVEREVLETVNELERKVDGVKGELGSCWEEGVEGLRKGSVGI
ncbi:PRELI-like family-domain-containing protein [Gaertneriomyces semiglobifer]|nr:PRELI-like family-domain-containing protein [Gaertneriomyces semiglobifer]